MGGTPSKGTTADMRLKANQPASKSSSSSKKQASPININPKKAGALRAKAGVKQGQKIPLSKLQSLANSPNPATRRQAQFAINARSFKHPKGN